VLLVELFLYTVKEDGVEIPIEDGQPPDEVIYQVIKVHTKIGQGKQIREAYFPSATKSNKATLGTCSLHGQMLGNAVWRAYDELLTWNDSRKNDRITRRCKLNVYKIAWDGKVKESGHEDALSREDRVKREAAKAVYWAHTKFNESNRGDYMVIDSRITPSDARMRLAYGLNERGHGRDGLLPFIAPGREEEGRRQPRKVGDRLPAFNANLTIDPAWPWRVVSLNRCLIALS
jgi:hypothetical protein